MNYEAFVMRTVRNQRTPRTMDEAFRTPRYASSITKFYPAHRRAIAEIFPWLLVTAVIGCSVYSYNLLLDLL